MTIDERVLSALQNAINSTIRANGLSNAIENKYQRLTGIEDIISHLARADAISIETQKEAYRILDGAFNAIIPGINK